MQNSIRFFDPIKFAFNHCGKKLGRRVAVLISAIFIAGIVIQIVALAIFIARIVIAKIVIGIFSVPLSFGLSKMSSAHYLSLLERAGGVVVAFLVINYIWNVAQLLALDLIDHKDKLRFASVSFKSMIPAFFAIPFIVMITQYGLVDCMNIGGALTQYQGMALYLLVWLGIVMLFVPFSLASFAFLENKEAGACHALRISWHLTQGHRLLIFTLSVLVGACFMVVNQTLNYLIETTYAGFRAVEIGLCVIQFLSLGFFWLFFPLVLGYVYRQLQPRVQS
jgi:hypothetical protein